MSDRARRFARIFFVAAAAVALGPTGTARAADAGPATQAADRYTALARQLGDVDPVVRKSAFDALVGAPEAARPALVAALSGSRPAVAAAAAELMLRASWFSAGAPPAIRVLLQNYAHLPPTDRARTLRQFFTGGDLATRKLAVRVAQLERADAVVWQALSNVVLGSTWQPVLSAADAGPIPTPVLIARARGIAGMAALRSDQPLPPEALALLETALSQEQVRPSGSSADLGWAVNVLVDHDLTVNRPAAAAERLRLLVGRGTGEEAVDGENNVTLPVGNPVRPDALTRLLDLQARLGPLPGLDRDLIAAAGAKDDQVAITLAVMVRRLGDELSSKLLLDNALADRPGEATADKAERLFNFGDALIKAGLPDSAELAMQRCVAVEAPGLESITNAYLRLCDIHSAAGEEQLAGDCLQRAVDNLGPGGGLSIRRANGRDEAWPREDVQGRIAWLYLLAAKKRNDTAEMQKQALIVMESGTTDSEAFLDALPVLESGTPPLRDKEVVDAFFDRVYAKSSLRLTAAPGNPLWMNDMAWLCARSGRKLNEALDLATKAVAARPDEAAYLDTLAEAKFRTGSAAEALALEEKAVNLLPDNTFMHEQVDRFRKAVSPPAATQPH